MRAVLSLPFVLVSLLGSRLCVSANVSINVSTAPNSSVISATNDTTVPTSTVSSPVSPLPSNVTGSSVVPPVASASTESDITTSTAPAATATASTDPDIQIIFPRRIQSIISVQTGASKLATWLSTLGEDGKWPDSEIDYTAGCSAQEANWPAEVHWTRIVALSAAWHGGFAKAPPGFVKNNTLLGQIGLAMDWWFDRDFTVDSCLDTGGTGTCPCETPGLWNTNWFSNVIGVARSVGQACLLLTPELSSTQLSNCTHMTTRSFDLFYRTQRPGFLAGANTLDIASVGVSGGLISNNASMVDDAYSRVHTEVQIQTGFQVDGILTDGSFAQHRGLLYNGDYGKTYTNDVLELELEAGGTRFAAMGSSKAAFEHLMDASQWMVYQNTITGVLHWDFSTEGRSISFPVIDSQPTAELDVNLTEVKVLTSLWGSDVLQSVFTDLTTNTSNANVGSLVGNRLFWNSDYMVTRGDNYVTTLKMYSSRIHNAECTVAENPLGFHLADGTVYTYLKGNEYEDIAAAWDWNMIPGITVDYGATPLECDTVNVVGLSNFVGGTSTGSLGAAVMRYTNPITKAFTFQKAWFFFQDDVHHVTVSVLNSTTSAPVFSILDQRRHDGDVYVDLQPITDSGNFSHPHTLFHGSTGYLFSHIDPAAPPPSQLSVAIGNRTGAWSALGISKQPPETVDLFAAWLPHDPENLTQSISYTAFPGRTRSEFCEDALKSPLHTIYANTDVSAVQDIVHGTTMIAFWQPTGGLVEIPPSLQPLGVTMKVGADKAVVMILEESQWRVTVSDPSQTLGSVGLSFEIGLKRPEGWGSSAMKNVSVTLPGDAEAGSSVQVSLLDS